MCRYRWTVSAWIDQYICVNLCFEGCNKASQENQVLLLLIKLFYLLRTPSDTIFKCLQREKIIKLRHVLINIVFFFNQTLKEEMNQSLPYSNFFVKVEKCLDLDWALWLLLSHFRHCSSCWLCSLLLRNMPRILYSSEASVSGA